MERDRNLELLGLKKRDKKTLTENLNEANKKTIKFKRKPFKKGKHDDVLYAVKGENKNLLKEHINQLISAA